MLYGIALKIANNSDEAEQLVIETFISASSSDLTEPNCHNPCGCLLEIFNRKVKELHLASSKNENQLTSHEEKKLSVHTLLFSLKTKDNLHSTEYISRNLHSSNLRDTFNELRKNRVDSRLKMKTLI